MRKAERLAQLFDHAKADAANSLEALRLQARAWRICALLGLVDRERGAKLAQWLLFKTVPWVDGDAVRKFIDENQAAAEIAGKKAGVFTA